MKDTQTAIKDSGDEAAQDSDEQLRLDAEHQTDDQTAEEASGETPSQVKEDANNDAERLRDTQRKLTELAEKTKVLEAQLSVYREMGKPEERRPEPVDEETFVKNLIGGDEVLELMREDPGKGATELVKRMVRHEYDLLTARDHAWKNEVETLKQIIASRSPERAEFAEELAEIQAMNGADKLPSEVQIEIARKLRAVKGSASTGKTPPPAKGGKRVVEKAPTKPTLDASYMKSIGLVDQDDKLRNTLLGG